MRAGGRIVTINFASVDHRLISRVRIGLFAAAALFVCAAVVLAVQAGSSRSRAAAVERQVKELAAAEEKLRPALEERQELVRNLGQMSALVEARRFSWVRLLSTIEEVFPAGVALDRVELNPRERLVLLEGEARSPEALSSLMIGLQRTAMLRNPLLKRQSMEKGILSFHVTVNYQ